MNLLCLLVIPAQAGIQSFQALIDCRLRGNDAGAILGQPPGRAALNILTDKNNYTLLNYLG